MAAIHLRRKEQPPLLAGRGELPRFALDQTDLLQRIEVVDLVTEHALVAIEHLALPHRFSQRLDLEPFQVKRESGKAARNLRDTKLSAQPTRQQDFSIERSIRDWSRAKAGVDLIHLLLIERRQMLGHEQRAL